MMFLAAFTSAWSSRSEDNRGHLSTICSHLRYLNSTHSSTRAMELTSWVPAADGPRTHTRSTRSSRYWQYSGER